MHDFSFVKNIHLFELDKYQELNISQSLVEYLSITEHPWRALGKKLSEYLNHLCCSIPLENRLQGRVSDQAYLENKDSIVLCQGAVIEPGAFVAGPCFIESGAVIRHGAYVRGSVYISSHAVVGHTTECKGSILLPNAKAAHFNYVGDSILGCDANLGAGTKLANLKLNHKNIFLKFNDSRLDSGLKKMGAILGNRVQTGCNSVTNPGTILFPDLFVLPNQTVSSVNVR
jgi:NDP-sugar pyrophosphorylase family protein